MTRLTPVLAATLLHIALPASATMFSGLGSGERVEVSVVSTGCFHGFSMRIVVHGGARPYAAFSRTPVAEDDNDFVRPLTAQELAALDEYTRRLRANALDGMCTTQEQFVLRWYMGEQVAYEEQLSDTSCLVSIERFLRPDAVIMGFTELLELTPQEDAPKRDIGENDQAPGTTRVRRP